MVCIKTKTKPNWGVEKDKDYTVLELKKCGCGKWWVDVGLRAAIKHATITKHLKCGTVIAYGGNTVYCEATLFAPKNNFQSITLEKVLEEETKLISVN